MNKFSCAYVRFLNLKLFQKYLKMSEYRHFVHIFMILPFPGIELIKINKLINAHKKPFYPIVDDRN